MRFKIIASGSKANATYVETEETKILIDVGVNYQYLLSALDSDGISPKDIDAILITHTHTDHIRGLASLTKRHNIPVYVTRSMVRSIKEKVDINNIKLMEEDFILKDLNIELIPVSHDTEGSLGFVLSKEDKSLVYITDTGYINQNIFPKIKNKNIYIFESNHDEKMVMDGPYHYTVKQRVLSDFGHLSNITAAKYLTNIVGRKTKKIILAHISDTNNTEEIAYKTVKDELEVYGIKKEILIAKQHEPLDMIEV